MKKQSESKSLMRILRSHLSPVGLLSAMVVGFVSVYFLFGLFSYLSFGFRLLISVVLGALMAVVVMVVIFYRTDGRFGVKSKEQFNPDSSKYVNQSIKAPVSSSINDMEVKSSTNEVSKAKLVISDELVKKGIPLRVTVVEILLKDRAKHSLFVYSVLIVALMIYLLACYKSGNSVSLGTLFILLLFILARYINQYALEYRLRHGYYGTTEYEAREIIGMILKHSDKSDFSSGNGLRELLPEPERGDGRIGILVPSPYRKNI
jgi:hypothetical protein